MGLISRLFGNKASNPVPKNSTGGTYFERLRQAFEHFSFSAKEQSSAVQQAMASIEEMRAMLSQSDEHVSRSQTVAEKAKEHGTERLLTVEKMQQTMSAMKDTNTMITELQSSFIAIKNKTRVINDIVFKTQLLSFNASIEAARAGQFGKGFSVVAEEVGRLAQMSGRAAKEIETLISDSQKKAMNVVGQVVERAEEGAKISNEVIVSFQELNQAMSEISKSLRAMSDASKEQLLGMEQTTIAIERINQLTEENHKNTENLLYIAEKSAPSDGVSMGRPVEIMKVVDAGASPSVKADLKDLDADHSSFRSQS